MESEAVVVCQKIDYFSLVVLTHITFNHKITNALFHTIPEKRTFDLVIGFGEPGVPRCGCIMKLKKYRGFNFLLFT